MTAKYLLPCQCGQQLPVDVSQSGLTLSCACGAKLVVPTLRGLRELPRITEAVEVRSPWGPREGMALIGVLIILIGLGMAVWFLLTPPPPLTKEMVPFRELSSTPSMLYRDYQMFRKNGMDTTPAPFVQEHEDRQRTHVTGTYAWFGVAAAGALVVALAFLFFQKPRRRPA